MIIHENSRVISKLETLLTDNARVVIYDRHIFIVQVTDLSPSISCVQVTDETDGRLEQVSPEKRVVGLHHRLARPHRPENGAA